MKSKLAPWMVLSLLALGACGGSGGAGGGAHGTAPSALAYSESLAVYLVDTPHAALSASVDGQVTHWSISPALPDGLLLDPDDGTISGTPSASAPRRSYVVRASNAAGFAEASLELSVERAERHVYVTSRDDSTISILAVDAGSGRVSRRGFVVTPAGEGMPELFRVHPAGSFGYSTSIFGSITRWAVDASSGWLTRLGATPADIGPHALSFTPDGAWLLVANWQGNDVSVFRVAPANGALEALLPDVAVAAHPAAIAVDPSGTRVLVACQGDAATNVGSLLQLFAFDAASGALSELGAPLLLNGARPSSCAFAPDRDVFYVGLSDAARLLAVHFERESGSLSSLGSAYSGAGLSALGIEPCGRMIWTVNADAGTLAAFKIQADGSLSAQSSSAAGSQPLALALDPLARFAFAIDATQRELTTFDLDLQNASTTQRDAWLVRGRPTDVSFGCGEHAASARARALLAAAEGSSDISVHAVDATDGSLGAASPVAAGLGALSLAVDPRQRFAFSADALAGTVSRFAIDPASAALTPLLPPLAAQGKPTHVACDASGRFVYVAARDVLAADDGWIETFAIDPSTGALGSVGSTQVGARPVWCGTDPTGQFLYVANSGDGSSGSATLSILRLNPQSGLPSSAAPAQSAPGAWNVAFHPSGKYLYAALRSANVTVPFQIDAADGSLALVGGGVRAEAEPVSVRLTPDGRFGYVAYRNTGSVGSIGLYPVDPHSGALVAPASLYVDGLEPVDLAIDPTGHFLYVANHGSDSISPFGIAPADGALSALVPVPSGLAPAALVLVEQRD